MNKIKSKKQIVLEYLQTHKSITILEAIYEMGITRLGAVIFLLKKDGYIIETTMKEVTARNGRKTSVAEYSLVKEN